MFIHKAKQIFDIQILNEKISIEDKIEPSIIIKDEKNTLKSNVIENRNNILESSIVENENTIYKYFNILTVFISIPILGIIFVIVSGLFMDKHVLYNNITVEKYNINSKNTKANSEIILVDFKKNNKLLAYFTDNTKYTLCENKDKCVIVSPSYFKKQIYDETKHTKTQVSELDNISFDSLLKYNFKDNKENINYYGNVKEVKISIFN